VFSKKRGDCEKYAVTVNGERGVVFTSGGVADTTVSKAVSRRQT